MVILKPPNTTKQGKTQNAKSTRLCPPIDPPLQDCCLTWKQLLVRGADNLGFLRTLQSQRSCCKAAGALGKSFGWTLYWQCGSLLLFHSKKGSRSPSTFLHERKHLPALFCQGPLLRELESHRYGHRKTKSWRLSKSEDLFKDWQTGSVEEGDHSSKVRTSKRERGGFKK